MKPKATTARKRARKAKPTRKAVRVHLAGRVTSFFKRKNSLWGVSVGRVWAAFGKGR